MEEKYLEGIESGADAYITKPFSISLLLARISKLIEQRDKLREKFSNEPGMVHAAICTNNKDSKFLAKLNEMLNEHMVETEFSVDDYANLMDWDVPYSTRKCVVSPDTLPMNTCVSFV